MAIKKKKKKKEEFDASLMGGYLPGARKPVASITPREIHQRPRGWVVPQTPVLIMNPHSHEYGVEHEHWEGGLLTRADEFIGAWAYYGIAGAADPKNILEAFAWRRAFGVPLIAGYALAGVQGFFATGLALTLIDPAHKWSGGLDETKIYQRTFSPELEAQGGAWDWRRAPDWFNPGSMGSLT